MLSLQYMGHPVFDVGLATIVAHVDKDSPADLTEDDLHSVADFIETYYTQQPLTSFLMVSLMNSGFANPAYANKPECRLEYAKLVGRNFGSDVPTSEEVCIFTGQPALGLSLSLKDKEGRDKLPLGRAYRQHIPLITGEGVINFSAWGDPGLPVSGEALLCLQFFPMGCRKCGGRLLAMHSDNPQIILAAARQALRENTEAISLARARGETKLQDASSSPQTLLIETILDMDLRQLDAKGERQPYSITGYHLTNSGQSSPLDENSPPLRIYHLPMNIVRFLSRAWYNPDYQRTWRGLVERGWERSRPAKNKDNGEEDNSTAPAKRRRNYLYEDIFRLPENARYFVRTYLLRSSRRGTVEDPRSDYSLRKDIDLISWQFTELFLEEVMHMDKNRIAEIGKLGETLATYIKESNDKRFFREFYTEQKTHDFRTVLLRANRNQVLRGKAPLFGLNSFCTVFFEEDGDTLKLDWKFARDLAYIRMIEALHANGWLGKNPDALPDEQDMDYTSLNEEQLHYVHNI